MITQRDMAWVKTQSAVQVDTAARSGELDELLGRQPRVDPPADQADLEQWLSTATPDQVVAAHDGHQLDSLLGIVRNEFGHTADELRGVPHGGA